MRSIALVGLLLGAIRVAQAEPGLQPQSNSLVAVHPDGARLAVANPDRGTVTLVDLKTRQATIEFPAGDHPEGVAWAGPGLLLATVYGDDRLLFLDTATNSIAHILPVPDEPYGVVANRAGTRAYVTHDYPGSISVIDVPNRKVLHTFAVGQGCRGIALNAEETTLYVTEFLTGTLLSVDPATGKVAERFTARTTDNMARHVELHPKRPKAYLSHIRSVITSFSATASIAPVLSVCDLKPLAEARRRIVPLDAFNGAYVIATPWEAAIHPDGRRMYTIYSGTNDGNVCRLIDDDYREAEPIGRPVRLGKLPRAIRVAPGGTEVYVYSAIDGSISIFDDDMKKELARVKVCDPAHTPEWVRGKELFALAALPMTSERWVACASCHPDGFSDGRIWNNPDGPRKTPLLFGLASTHPLHYSADRDEVQDFEYTIRGKLMLGRGLYSGRLRPAELDEPLAGKSKDLDALAIYTNSFPVRLSPHNPAPGQLSESATRGKALFENTKTQCATCHSGPYYSDSTLTKPYKLYDVGTGDDPREKLGPKFDTPSLLMVYRSAPYLHDGRAKTLHDVLTMANKADQHGVTSHLKPAEVDDLVEFLKALPYEFPPDNVPNTVKDRVKLTYPDPRRDKPTVPTRAK
ncbi:MAG: hypothetical protein ACRCZF_09550 [Gemmataceae bacterium]